GAAERLGGEHRRGETRLHVADAAAVDPSVADHARERIDGPPVARRNHVGVAVEVNDRTTRRSAARAHHVHAWKARGMLGPAVGDDEVDVEAGPLQPVADQPGGRFVRLPRRVDGRYPDQIDGERDDLVGRAIDLGDHAVDDSAAHRSPKKYRMPSWTSRPGRYDTGVPNAVPETALTLATLSRLKILKASISTLAACRPKGTFFSTRRSRSA